MPIMMNDNGSDDSDNEEPSWVSSFNSDLRRLASCRVNLSLGWVGRKSSAKKKKKKNCQVVIGLGKTEKFN